MALFLLAFLIYNINFRPIATGDSVPAALMPIVILTKGSMVMDEYNQYYLDYYKKKFHGQESILAPYFFTPTKFGYLSSYPVATGLLLTPFYAVPVYLYNLAHPTTAQWVFFAVVAEKISASAITATTVVFFSLLAKQLGASRFMAWMLSFAYAFASEAWVISSQALWQHGPGILFALSACLMALRHDKSPSARDAFLFGLLCGISVAVRPTNLLLILPLYAWVMIKRPSYVAYYVLPATAIAIVLGAYNMTVFKDLRGGYQGPFNALFWEGFSGVLFSPGRGLFLYFPLAIFGFLGFYRGLREKSVFLGFYSVLLVSAGLQILLFSKWYTWWGGHCFGPRYLSEIQPLLLLAAIPFFQSRHFYSKWAIFFIFLIWSVSLQAVGAFIYPMGAWNSSPHNIDKVPSRLWDWRDNRCEETWLHLLIRTDRNNRHYA